MESVQTVQQQQLNDSLAMKAIIPAVINLCFVALYKFQGCRELGPTARSAWSTEILARAS